MHSIINIEQIIAKAPVDKYLICLLMTSISKKCFRSWSNAIYQLSWNSKNIYGANAEEWLISKIVVFNQVTWNEIQHMIGHKLFELHIRTNGTNIPYLNPLRRNTINRISLSIYHASKIMASISCFCVKIWSH